MAVRINYLPRAVSAQIVCIDIPGHIVNRITSICRAADSDAIVQGNEIVLNWGNALIALPQIANLRGLFGFRIEPDPEVELRLRRYQRERNSLNLARSEIAHELLEAHIIERLQNRGWDFTKRELRDHQISAIRSLAPLINGANFSVPGAGKTTVTFAIHLFSQSPETHLLVVCPKNAFSAWDDVVNDCLRDDMAMERFIRLEGTDENIRSQLFAGGRRFLINYEKLVACPRVITDYVASRPVHIVLDESHRIKNAVAQRSQALIRIAPLSIRRDILSGTPLPNSAEDLASQLEFLWPGSNLPARVRAGEAPRSVLQGIYVRVTKSQLGLPPVNRRFVPVRMGQAQYALYGALKDDAIRDILAIRGSGAAELIRAKRSVMRLMQASTNPVAIVEGMLADARTLNRDRVAALYHAVLQEGVSEKVLFAAERARELVRQGRKVVIWTIFQSTIESMLNEASDLAPIFINGTVESGSANDPTTREGKIRLFHNNPGCAVLIANPAACSEGISLHTVCHEAIYLDRGYNAAHYLQSIDRIHRLGLARDVETNISILQSITPTGLASIDYSVARALLRKLRVMEAALEDEDIRQISLDEEENVANQVFDDSRDLEDMNELLDLLMQNPAATQFDETDMA